MKIKIEVKDDKFIYNWDFPGNSNFNNSCPLGPNHVIFMGTVLQMLTDIFNQDIGKACMNQDSEEQ